MTVTQFVRHTLDAAWVPVLEALSRGLKEADDYCLEGLSYRTNGLTPAELHGTAIFYVREAKGQLVLVHGEEERDMLLPVSGFEPIITYLHEIGAAPVSIDGGTGTKTEFQIRIDNSGALYLLPPQLKFSIEDQPVPDNMLFMQECLLNLIEATI